MIEFDASRVKASKMARVERAQKALDIQILKDSNYYCPDRSGTLMRSGGIASGGGAVVWDMPYARKQYHDFPNKSKDKNPNASVKWFEMAKAVMLKLWLEVANNEYSK